LIRRLLGFWARSAQTLFYLSNQYRNSFFAVDSFNSIFEFKTQIPYRLINPSIYIDGNQKWVVCRVTNSSVMPRSDFLGNMRVASPDDVPMNGLVRFRFDFNGILEMQWVSELSAPPNFEDPRAFFLEGKLFFVCNKLLSWGQSGWKTGVSLVRADSGTHNPLSFSQARKIDKNWLPLKNNLDQLEFIYSSKPFVILHFDEQFIAASKTQDLKHKFDYHGGTIPIMLPDGGFLRIARRRLRLWPFGLIHINYVLLYNSDFELIHESRPFLFSGLGFEVCNGAWLDGETLFLTWSEDDEDMILGRVELQRFIRWIFDYQKPILIVRLVHILNIIRRRRIYYQKTTLST